MALTGRLGADFTAFVTAVNNTETVLRKFEGDANKVGAALNKMGDAFSGRTVISQASLAVKAVQDIGGASMLTAEEQKRLNGMLDQAIQKYAALGQTAPQAMLDLKKETQGTVDVAKKLSEEFNAKEAIENPLQAAAAAAKTLAEALGPVGTTTLAVAGAATAMAAAIFEMTKRSAEAGEKIQNMYEKTGITAPALSRLAQAATIAGDDISTIGNAIFMFDKQIADSPDKVAKGLSRIGLSIEEIKQLNPEEQFTKISNAIAGMADVQTRNAAGAEIFGRAAKDLMPLLVNMNDALKLTNGLSVWTPEQAKEAEEFAMGLNALKLGAEEVALKIGKDLIPAIKLLVDELNKGKGLLPDFIGAAEDASGITGIKLRVYYLTEYLRLKKLAGELPEVKAAEPDRNTAVIAGFKQAEAAMLAQQKAAIALDDHLKTLKDTVVPLTKAQQDQAVAMMAGGDSAQEIAKYLGVSEKATKDFEEATKKANEQLKLVKDADYAASYQSVGLGIFDTGNRLQFMADALERTNKVFDIHSRIIQPLGPRYSSLHEQVTGLSDVNGNLIATVEELGLKAFPGLNDALGKTGFTTEQLRKQLKDMRLEAQTTSDKMLQVFGGVAGVLNNISGTFAEVGAMAARAGQSIFEAFDTGSLLQGWVSVATAVSGIVQKLWPQIKQLFGGPSKDEIAAREAFAKQWGSAKQALEETTAAYLKYGRTAKEAEEDVKAALAATHVSAEAEAAALDVINKKLAEGAARMQAFAAAQANIGQAATGFNAIAKALEGDRASVGALGNQALLTFAAMRASGQSLTATLTAMAPGIESLVQSYKRLGLNIQQTGLAALVMQEAILKDNPDLVAGIDGLSASMAALEGLGIVNAQSFADMEAAGSAMYTRLQAAAAANGGTTKDALLPMQQWLHDAAEEADKLGIPLDENTQRMVEQSKELGIWRDKAKTGIDGATDAMKGLIDAVKELIELWKQIPTQTPSAPSAPAAAAGATQHFAGGGIVLPFPGGARTGLVQAETGELILNPQQQQALVTGGGGGELQITVVSQIDGRTVAKAVTRIQSRDLQTRRKLGAA